MPDVPAAPAVMLPAAARRPPPAWRRPPPARRHWRRQVRFPVLAFTAMLIAGTALRLWRLAGSPAWQWDEAVYYRVAVNVQHGVLGEHAVRGMTWAPFLYQPPFYFLALARWFGAVGASIYHARILGVILTAAMLTAAFRLLWKIHGPGTALFAIAPIIFDGWLIYIERISYMENALLLVIAVACWLYQRALEQPAWHRFAAAGLALGLAAIFKQTGCYGMAAVLLCWLITRRGHQGHLVLLGVFLTVVAAYAAVMIRLYDVPGNDWFTSQTLVQLRRVLGLQHSGGTLTSPASALHLLTAQYRFFIPSAAIALMAFLIAVRRLAQCYRARNWGPAQGNALLFSWLAAGVVVFGLSSLKFPQYFALILLPAYCFGWTELARWDCRPAWKGTVAAAAALAGAGSFLLSGPVLGVNTLAQAQQYAAAQIPADSIVVTEQGVGDLIKQSWCTVENAAPCLHAASYAITWRTYLQSSFRQGDVAFRRLMNGAVPVRSFSGPVGTATVWKLRRSA